MSTPFSSRFVDLLDLPDEEALRLHFSIRNYGWFRGYGFAFTAVAVLALLYFLAEAAYLKLLLPAANLLLVRGLFMATEKDVFQRQFRHILSVYLLLQTALLAAYDPFSGQGREVLAFAAPVLLVPFRFQILRSLILYWILLMAALAPEVWPLLSGGPIESTPRLLWLVVVFAGCATLNIAWTRHDYLGFTEQFREQSSRHRERKRMREELDYARRIQLQMLPQGDPRLDELDLCGICLPATEVGGDYYEYFPRSSTSMAIAIGDVAGHGVASGLLLSGIRSCLYLLQPEDLAPSEILRRLNRMVRDTNESRMFITLLYAVIDYAANTVVLSSAGHPPLLHCSRSKNRVTEIGQGAPPLGTRLEPTFTESRLDFEPGDVLLFITDGLHEMQSPTQDQYGLDRLADLLREHAHKESRQIREAILSDVWNFKGNAEQEDDITLVVVRCREVPASGPTPTA